MITNKCTGITQFGGKILQKFYYLDVNDAILSASMCDAFQIILWPSNCIMKFNIIDVFRFQVLTYY